MPGAVTGTSGFQCGLCVCVQSMAPAISRGGWIAAQITRGMEEMIAFELLVIFSATALWKPEPAAPAQQGLLGAWHQAAEKGRGAWGEAVGRGLPPQAKRLGQGNLRGLDPKVVQKVLHIPQS